MYIYIYICIELTNFGMDVSLVYGVLGYFEPKTHKSFELYQVFMYEFLCQTVLILSIHIIHKKNHILVQKNQTRKILKDLCAVPTTVILPHRTIYALLYMFFE